MRLNTQQLLRIFNDHLGLRSGTEVANAAYAMDDFGDGTPRQIFDWIRNPDTDRERGENWEHHLYNSIWKINDLSQQNFNLLILDKAPWSGESYNAPGGRGDYRTFKKCNQVQQDSQLIEEMAFNAGNIEGAFNWVIENIRA
jgi:hypothetical protein